MRLAAPFAALLIISCAGDPPPPLEARAAPLAAPDPGVIHLAGSGAMAPLASALAAAYQRRNPAPRLVIDESLGSTGGIAATVDGAVDIGLVSRPLSEAERRLDLLLTPVGFDAVVIAGHPDVTVSGVTSDELRELYSGTRRTFADGTRATVLLRDRGESANGVLERLVPGLTAARDGSPPRARLRVLYHDAAMIQALASTPGAIGVCSFAVLEAANARLKLLAIDGHVPSAATLQDGSWPAVRPLSLVVRRGRAERVQGFLDFVASDEGAAAVRGAGYRPEGAR